MKTARALTAIMMLAFILLVGCSRETSSNNTLKIGAILPLTGTGAEDGEFQKHGIDLAVSKLNAAGGIKGKKVAKGITTLRTSMERPINPLAKNSENKSEYPKLRST